MWIHYETAFAFIYKSHFTQRHISYNFHLILILLLEKAFKFGKLNIHASQSVPLGRKPWASPGGLLELQVFLPVSTYFIHIKETFSPNLH